jgi:D-tyrosyl-tRNA(Tyr) deacylase
MKFVIQRVSRAAVSVREKTIASIEKGLLVLAGIQQGDTEETLDWMVRKTLKMRIFEDDEGQMNCSVCDEEGELLFVPNFTLYADPSKGNRPSFIHAEKPDKAQSLYKKIVEITKGQSGLRVQSGEFGADMEVSLVNDGPVTIILEQDAKK